MSKLCLPQELYDVLAKRAPPNEDRCAVCAEADWSEQQQPFAVLPQRGAGGCCREGHHLARCAVSKPRSALSPLSIRRPVAVAEEAAFPSRAVTPDALPLPPLIRHPPPSHDAAQTNQIVYCERCDVAVHQLCYGIAAVPEGDWLCDPCREHEGALRAQGKSEVCACVLARVVCVAVHASCVLQGCVRGAVWGRGWLCMSVDWGAV